MTLHDAARAADLYSEASVAGASAPCARVTGRRRGAPGAEHGQSAPPTTSSTRWTPRGRVRRLGRGAGARLYAAAQPTADVEGFDAAAKAAILAQPGVPHQGQCCRRAPGTFSRGHPGRHRQRAHAGLRGGGGGEAPRSNGVCSVRVHPAMIPRARPLAGVREAYNAGFVGAGGTGPALFYSAGAGGVPTPVAVLGDIVAAARNRLPASTQARTRRPTPTCCRCNVRPGTDPLPHLPGHHRRPCVGPGRGSVSPARRVDRGRCAPGGPGRTGHAHSSSWRTWRRTRRWPPAWVTACGRNGRGPRDGGSRGRATNQPLPLHRLARLRHDSVVPARPPPTRAARRAPA